MHADGHIRDDADLHTGLAGGLLRRVQLIGGDPLKPAVELKGVRELLTQLRDFFGITVVFAHPIIGVVGGSAPLVVAQAPGGVGFDLVSAFGEVTVEFGLASLGSAGLVDDPQRMLLDAPHGVAIDQPRVVIQRFDLLVQRIDFSPVLVGQREIFRHGLRTDVAEIDETAGNRQIRRWRQRRHRLRGVHRVDKHEVGAGLLFSLDQHGLQIFEVSHAPGSLGTDGVQLAHPPPQGAVLHIIEQFDFLRSADNGCSLRLAADSDLEGVIAFGQIGGQDEIRREEEAAINLMGDFLTASWEILPVNCLPFSSVMEASGTSNMPPCTATLLSLPTICSTVGATTRVSRSDLMDVMDWLIASSLEASIPSALSTATRTSSSISW